MRYLKNLYFGDTAKENAERNVDDLRSGRFVRDLYAVIAPVSDNVQAEVIRSFYLKQAYYLDRDPLVIGVAKGKSEALSILVTLTEEAVEELGEPDIRRYIEILCERGEPIA